jgi:large subunit ribosomal protein L21
MKYAVIKIGGHQYKVAEGDEIVVDKLPDEKGKEVTFKEVILLVGDGKVKIGKPYLKESSVKGEIVEHFKGPKIRVATYKAKSRYRRVKGHRSSLTRVKIKKIV